MKTLTDELTALNLQARKERTLANITRRAASLFSDGYTAIQTQAGQFVTCYQVLSPKGDRYAVKVSKTPAAPGSFYGSRCSCPCFAEWDTCKHLQALELQEAQEADEAAREAAMCAEWEAAEEQRNFFGFDRYDF